MLEQSMAIATFGVILLLVMTFGFAALASVFYPLSGLVLCMVFGWTSIFFVEYWVSRKFIDRMRCKK